MLKICTKCNVEKPYEEYGKDRTKKDGLNYWCKVCVNGYYNNNKQTHKARTAAYINSIKEKHSSLMKDWYQSNKNIHNQTMTEWRNNNIDYFKDYFQNNKEDRYIYKKQRYKEDINYRIKHKIRDRIQKALKNNSKKGKTVELLGCDISEYKQYLESKFKPEMNWNNHGDVWEIDHIIPCDSFNLIELEQQKQCFHYTNTQPLFKTTEIAKSFGHNEIGNKNKLNNIHTHD